METSVLLQRQMELHGTLRRPPHTPVQLKEVHEILKKLSIFFRSVRDIANILKNSPETVFQCLMQIGLGDIVSFDKQRRDGAVPMHQAKVLSRKNAIELEPRLRNAIPSVELEKMVENCKITRTLLRIKVEDGNDFTIAEVALNQAIEYLDYIENASGKNSEIMFKFYMVEDEASLLSLLGSDSPCVLRGVSENGSVSENISIIPSDSHLDDEVRRLAQKFGSTTVGAGDRLHALRTLQSWLESLSVEKYNYHISSITSHIAGPLSVCAAEKRSAICRQACSLIITLAARTPAVLYREGGPLRAALPRWISALLRGVFVTVAAISHATDAATRGLLRGSCGAGAGRRPIAEALEAATHPELRRRCLAYLALAIVAEGRGNNNNNNTGEGHPTPALPLTTLAVKYTEVGDTACRRMARALCIALTHYTEEVVVVRDKKTEALIRQETIELKEALEDVEKFEVALFGSVPPWKGVSTMSNTPTSATSSLIGSTRHLSTTPSSPLFEMKHDVINESNLGEVYDTSATLGGKNIAYIEQQQQQQQQKVLHSPLASFTMNNNNNNNNNSNNGYRSSVSSSRELSSKRAEPRSLGNFEPGPTKPKEQKIVKLSASLRRKIENASSRSLSQN